MAHPKLWGTTDTRNGLPTTTRESPDFSHGECQPESYEIVQCLIGTDVEKLDLIQLSKELDVGIFTFKGIVEEFKKPGRDPGNELPKPIFRRDVQKLRFYNLI